MRTLHRKKAVGKTNDSDRRRTIWAAARRVRDCLLPNHTQREVGAAIGCSQQMVDKIELMALSKIIARFAPERITEAAAMASGCQRGAS